MRKVGKTQFAAMLVTAGLFGWTYAAAAADVHIAGQSKQAVVHSQIPLLHHGPQVLRAQATFSNEIWQ